MSGEIVFDCCLPRAHLPLRLSPRNVPTMKPSTYLPWHQLRPTPTSDWVMSVAQAPYTAIRLAPASSAPRDTITSVVCRSDRQDTVMSVARPGRTRSITVMRPVSVLVMYARRPAARRPQLPDRSGSIQKIESWFEFVCETRSDADTVVVVSDERFAAKRVIR